MCSYTAERHQNEITLIQELTTIEPRLTSLKISSNKLFMIFDKSIIVIMTNGLRTK